MRSLAGKTTTKERAMSEKIEEQTIVAELAPAQHVRDDGRIVHTDISGAVLKDENGDVEEIIFFVSPSYLRERAE
jgi:hypothetical protein